MTDIIDLGELAKKKKVFLIAPMNKRISVRIEAPMSMTKGGIIIPDTIQKKEAPTRGTVMAIAKDCRDDIRALIKPGMQVIFSKFAGVDIYVTKEGEESKFQLLKEEDILAVIVDRDEIHEYIHVNTGDVFGGVEGTETDATSKENNQFKDATETMTMDSASSVESQEPRSLPNE